MNKPITETYKFLNGNTLIDLGFRDYIAARFLLNHEFVVQGLTLASTAVEKYLKSIIVLTTIKKEKYNYHLDNIEKLKTILSNLNHDVTEKFDPIFVEILANAFKIRYYDKIDKPIFIGLHLNQFLGELDYTIDFLERYVMKVQELTTSISPYQRAILDNDSNLFKNNYLLNKQNKKEFMEKQGTAFSINISITPAVHNVVVVKTEKIATHYDGQLQKFDDFKPKQFIDGNFNNYR